MSLPKKIIVIASAAFIAVPLFACAAKPGNPADAFPARNIRGIVQWGAGGGTDSLMRPLAARAEEELGVSVVVQNMAGATGSIATQYVYDAPADGYTLLLGAENPALYKALEISSLTYDNFDCLFLLGDETVGIAVGAAAPFRSFTELVQAALAEPGRLKLATTGKGGLPWEVAAFITDVSGAVFSQIPYDSDASARTAVLNGECDFTVCKVQSGLEYHKAGTLNFLCMFALEAAAALPEVAPIIAEYPDFARYLPWGPFYGVFVKGGVDAAIAEKLSAALSAAALDSAYQELLANFNINYLGLTGVAAREYISTWQANTLQALKNSGALE